MQNAFISIKIIHLLSLYSANIKTTMEIVQVYLVIKKDDL
jgi:hypothetical protein